MKHIVKNLIVIFVSLTLATLVAEGALRIATDVELSGSWRVTDDRGLRLNKSDGFALHSIPGHTVTYSFRSPHLRTGPYRPGEHKILVLGDSFTFGWLLEWDHTYVGIFESELDELYGLGRFEIANAASGGTGLDSFLAFLKQYGEVVDPNIVMLFLNSADISRSIQNGLYKVQGDRLIASSRRVPWLKKIVEKLPGYNFLVSNFHFIELSRRLYLRIRYPKIESESLVRGPSIRDDQVGLFIEERENEGVLLAKRILEEMKDWCDSRGVNLVVLTTSWLNPPYDDGSDIESFMTEAPEFFSNLGIPFFDGSNLLVERKSDLRHPIHIAGDGHPNEDGSRIIAEINGPFLREQIISYCESVGCRKGI